MDTTGKLWRWLMMIAAVCLSAALAARSSAAEEPLTRQLGDDTFMTGGQLRLERPAPGDAVLAGGSVTVLAPVHGDGVFAGGELSLQGPFGQDVYAAGGQIRADAEIAGNARFAGGTVVLGPESDVRGGVSLAAGRAEIAGSIADYLQIAAGSTRLDARVSGDVTVNGGELELTPSALVEGDLVFTGPNAPRVAPGAVVRGEVRHIPAAQASAGERWLGTLTFSLVVCLGLALIAGLLWALWPGFTRAVEEVSSRKPTSALLAGVAAVLGLPIAIVLLFVSIIGIPLALLALPLYLMLFPLGYLAACASIADWLLARARTPLRGGWWKRIGTLVLVLFGLSLIALIPFVGWLPILLLTLAGIGALVLASIDAHRGTADRVPTLASRGAQRVPDEAAPASA